MNTAKYIRIDFFNRTPLMAASEFKSNISKVNLIKAKRSYFYILIIATQTKLILLRSMILLLYIVNINENLKKIDEKKRRFKHV